MGRPNGLDMLGLGFIYRRNEIRVGLVLICDSGLEGMWQEVVRQWELGLGLGLGLDGM